MFEDGIWTERGIFGGRLIDKAYEMLYAAEMTARLSVDVLDSLRSAELLPSALLSSELIEDIRMGRFGPEWHLERRARADCAAQELNENWTVIRDGIRERIS